MKVAFIGNFTVPFTTENDLTWSLQNLGHTVYQMQEQQTNAEEILGTCISQEVDLLLYVHTHNWETPGSITLDELFTKLKQLGIPTASFHLDYWRGLEREGDVGNHPFWRTEYVFTADGGSDQWYKDQGINHFWLPPGVVERDCYYAQPADRFNHEIVFVGSSIYHKEWPYREELVRWLHMTYGERFAHYGNGGLPNIRGHELNTLYRSARVVVGDSLCLGYKHTDYWSDRVPETIGRGGFLIHPAVPGIEKHYKDGKQIVLYPYGDFDMLKKQIDYYVSNYAERERIRLDGHLYVKANQTYTNRMQQMLDTIFKEDK